MTYSVGDATYLTFRQSLKIGLSPWLVSVAVLLLAVHSQAQSVANSDLVDKTPTPCTITDLDFDASTDVQAIKKYEDAVGQLLKQDSFDALDCIADSLRSNKKKFAGGRWKLHTVYSGLTEPTGHATAEDWSNHLARLERWIKAKPDSITARVALARAYTSYAWDARGTGFSDSVTDSGWKLYGERIQMAKTVLDQASTLQNKCPEWFVAMQQVAQGEGWDPAQLTALLQRAIAFEPTYDLFYRTHAVLILPKWFGEDGDSEKFAAGAADRIGGAKGDILYFQIAVEMVCLCDDEPQLSRMSWPRIQKGFAELEKEYGQSLQNVNSFALMAVKNNDSVVADAMFKRIGDSWDKETWQTQPYFNSNKSWAAQFARMELHAIALRQAADENMKTAEGVRYKKQFDQKFTGLMRQCVQTKSDDLEKFELMIRVGIDGSPEDASSLHPTPVTFCLIQQLRQAHEGKKRPFPRPPHPSYWVKLDLDPSMFTIASK